MLLMPVVPPSPLPPPAPPQRRSPRSPASRPRFATAPVSTAPLPAGSVRRRGPARTRCSSSRSRRVVWSSCSRRPPFLHPLHQLTLDLRDCPLLYFEHLRPCERATEFLPDVCGGFVARGHTRHRSDVLVSLDPLAFGLFHDSSALKCPQSRRIRNAHSPPSPLLTR